MKSDILETVTIKLKFLATWFGLFISGVFALLGMSIIGAQVVFWLQDGYWISLPVIVVLIDPAWIEPSLILPSDISIESITSHTSTSTVNLFWVLEWGLHRYLGDFSLWLVEPKSWLGVHQIVQGILEWTPLSGALFILAVVIGTPSAIFFVILDDEIKELESKRNKQERERIKKTLDY